MKLRLRLVLNIYIWLWVAIEPKHRQILQIDLSSERTMLVAERFIASLINKFGKCPVSTDGGTWYPQACQFLDVEHHISIPHLRKVSLLKEHFNTSKIELKDLMIIFHVERRSVS
jgi:transposase-like protein